ncbi:MAG: FAD-dependent oxidoreductase [Brevinematales bacterium]|nr:FAD-dependent oxidoreductase [Brevinematales bacterium]
MYNIVVLGGGYAGVKLVKHLLSYANRSSVSYKVTLIDRNEFQCLLPSLPAVISNREEKVLVYYRDIFSRYSNFEFIKGDIEAVDLNCKAIILYDGREVRYDQVVFAFGVEPSDFGIEGVKSYSIMFWNERDLEKYVRKIDEFISNNKSPRIVIVGAGPIGVEVASETSHYLKTKNIKPNILILEAKDRCLPSLPPSLGRTVEYYLLRENVDIAYNSLVCKIDDKKVYTLDGREFEYDIILWCSGVVVNSLVRRIEDKSNIKFEKGAQGRIVVDESLRVKSLDNVWAIGDIAIPENQKVVPIPLAQFAVQMADVAGFNIPRYLEGKPLKKLSLSFRGIIIQMSKFSAAAMVSRPFEIIIPPSLIGVSMRRFVDYSYIISIGAKPRKYPL